MEYTNIWMPKDDVCSPGDALKKSVDKSSGSFMGNLACKKEGDS